MNNSFLEKKIEEINKLSDALSKSFIKQIEKLNKKEDLGIMEILVAVSNVYLSISKQIVQISLEKFKNDEKFIESLTELMDKLEQVNINFFADIKKQVQSEDEKK